MRAAPFWGCGTDWRHTYFAYFSLSLGPKRVGGLTGPQGKRRRLAAFFAIYRYVIAILVAWVGRERPCRLWYYMCPIRYTPRLTGGTAPWQTDPKPRESDGIERWSVEWWSTSSLWRSNRHSRGWFWVEGVGTAGGKAARSRAWWLWWRRCRISPW